MHLAYRDEAQHKPERQAGPSEFELTRNALKEAFRNWQSGNGENVCALFAVLSKAAASAKALYWFGDRKVDLPPVSIYVQGHEIKVPQWALVRGTKELERSAEVDVSLEDYAAAVA